MDNLSVVLCTYNEEKFIGKTLIKLINNEIINEIIVIDDNSNDSTINIINKIQSNKIKLFVRKNTRGFASALSYGISMTSQKYILRFDVDMHQSVDLFMNGFQKFNKAKMELTISI